MSQIVKPQDDEWQEWLKICAYCDWDPHGLLKPMKYRGKIIPFSPHINVGPVFYNELVNRIENIKPIRMTITGEAGSSKTYTGIWLATMLDPDFSVDQIVLFGKDFIHLQRTLQPKRVILLDEPTFTLASRTWYELWQRCVVRIIESSRFQNNPLVIPIVNRMLLDKVVREYYVNYQIQMFDRGIGRVYRTKHSQWYPKLMRETHSNIYLYGPGVKLAECGRTTCLGCPELETCNKNIFPQYERKRAQAVAYYQEEAEREIKELDEKKKVTFADIAQDAAERRKEYLTPDGKDYLVSDLMVEYDLGHAKAYDLRSWLLKHYPLTP